MMCPNCGLANPDNAKFCANCGTQFGNAASSSTPPPGAYQTQSQYNPVPPYQGSYQPPAATGGSSIVKNIAIGCLIVLAIFMFLTLSCTRACFGLHRGRTYIHRRYF